MPLHLTLDQWLVAFSVIAVIASPLFALEVQKRLDYRRNNLDRKMRIFRTLMTTRATALSPAHVEALNAIEVEFYSHSGPDKRVLDAWRIYINHLNTAAGEGDALSRWVEKKTGLFVDLLYAMAQRLGYDIDKVTMQKNVYYPKGIADVEAEQAALRKAALEVFSGSRPLTATLVGPIQTTPALPLLSEIQADPIMPALPAPQVSKTAKAG